MDILKTFDPTDHKLIAQSLNKHCQQIHDIKQNRFFFGMLDGCQNCHFCVAVKTTCF